MTKYLPLIMIAGLLGGSPVFAKGHCNCDKQCQEQCAKGEGKDCKCKDCDCKSGKKCKHGKCNTAKQEASTEEKK